MNAIDQFRSFVDEYLDRQPDERLPSMKTVWHDTREFDGWIAAYEFRDGAIQFDVMIGDERIRSIHHPEQLTLRPDDDEIWLNTSTNDAIPRELTYVLDLGEQTITRTSKQ